MEWITQRDLFEESCIQCSEFEQTGFRIYQRRQTNAGASNPIDEMKPQWLEDY
jgi:hypothetical protein